MLQATRFTFKEVAKQNYFTMGDAETLSCDLRKTFLLQLQMKIAPCPRSLNQLMANARNSNQWISEESLFKNVKIQTILKLFAQNYGPLIFWFPEYKLQTSAFWKHVRLLKINYFWQCDSMVAAKRFRLLKQFIWVTTTLWPVLKTCWRICVNRYYSKAGKLVKTQKHTL